jgi:hypothetical protein
LEHSLKSKQLASMTVWFGLSPILTANVIKAISAAKSSVFFSLDENTSASVIDALKKLQQRGQVVVGGIVHSGKGDKILFRKGELLREKGKISREARAGAKSGAYIVIDYNTRDGLVFAGSGSFSEDTLVGVSYDVLAIRDRALATRFAVEAIEMIDRSWFSALDDKYDMVLYATDQWTRKFSEPGSPHEQFRALLSPTMGDQIGKQSRKRAKSRYRESPRSRTESVKRRPAKSQ